MSASFAKEGQSASHSLRPQGEKWRREARRLSKIVLASQLCWVEDFGLSRFDILVD